MTKRISFILLLFLSSIGFSQTDQKIKTVELFVVDASGSTLTTTDLAVKEGKKFKFWTRVTLENGEVIGETPYSGQRFFNEIEIEGIRPLMVRRGTSPNPRFIGEHWLYTKDFVKGGDNTITVRVKRKEDKKWQLIKTVKIIRKLTEEELLAIEMSRELIYTDAEIAQIQKEFKSFGRTKQVQMARSFHTYHDTMQTWIGMGIKGLDEEGQSAMKSALDRADDDQDMLDLQYWINAPEVNPIASLDKIYTFKQADTLDFDTGASKNIAFLKEGNTIVKVKTYSTDTPDENGFVRQYGFTINTYDFSSGKLLKKLSKSVESSFKQPSGISINQFKSCPTGYILVNSDMFYIFNKQLEVVFKGANSSKTMDKLYLDVEQVGNSNKYIIFYGDPTHVEYRENNYYIRTDILDMETGSGRIIEEEGDLVDQIIKSSDCIETPSYSHVYSTSNSEFVVVYFEDKTTRIKKYKIENNRKKDIWSYEFDGMMQDIKRIEKSKFMFCADSKEYPSRRYLMTNEVYTIDFSSNNINEVKASYKEKFSAGSSDLSLDRIYIQADGSILVLGSTTGGDNPFGYSSFIRIYNPDFSMRAQYRVSLPAAAEAADFGYNLYRWGGITRHSTESNIAKDPKLEVPQHQYSGRTWRYTNRNGQYVINSGSDYALRKGMIYKDEPDVLTNAVTFFNGHNTSLELVLEGDIIYMMTPYALVKLDLNHVVEAKPYKGRANLIGYKTVEKVFSREYYIK